MLTQETFSPPGLIVFSRMHRNGGQDEGRPLSNNTRGPS